MAEQIKTQKELSTQLDQKRFELESLLMSLGDKNRTKIIEYEKGSARNNPLLIINDDSEDVRYEAVEKIAKLLDSIRTLLLFRTETTKE